MSSVLQGITGEGHTGLFRSNVIGRVYTIHPSNAECSYLQMLLHEVHGPKSFDDLKTANGHLRETYREACQLRGLLESDNHWMNTMEEAASSQMPQQLRQLFAIIISTCAQSNLHNL